MTERAAHNPATQLVGVLKTQKTKHRNALDKKELPEFFNKLNEFDTHPIIKLATKFLIHTFVRTGELRFAEWDEIDYSDRLWYIPAERMKMNLDHLVPLTEQTLSILKQLELYNSHRKYIFASPQKPLQPISENAILNLLYRMGYKGKATGHGFRATASTSLNEMGYNPDAIERQLAHTEKNKIRAAYNRSEYLKERVSLMQGWSNFISSQSNKVIPIKSANG